MPDRRQHRGAHPQDPRLFADGALPGLRQATAELGWLLERGYAPVAALKLVGDHHQLQARQRLAVIRSACGADAVARRRAATVPLAGAAVVVDGFNQLITMEAALAGAALLRGADGRLRDLASVHGTYRSVQETERALQTLGQALAPAASVHWVLDRPVSNSGRLAARLQALGWTTELSDRADQALVDHAARSMALATSDGPLIDRAIAAGATLCDPLATAVGAVDGAWILDLGPPA